MSPSEAWRDVTNSFSSAAVTLNSSHDVSSAYSSYIIVTMIIWLHVVGEDDLVGTIDGSDVGLMLG